MGLIIHAIEATCMQPVMDDHTRQAYHFAVKKFEKWIKEEGISQRKAVRSGGTDLVQQYTDWLVSEGYSAWTVHSYVAPICKGYRISMSLIDKPPRVASSITKGRKAEVNPQGKRDMEKEKYQRIISFAKATGLRRFDYGRLTPADIHFDAAGEPEYIAVKSKGGKITHQAILPAHRETVKNTITGIKADEKVFETKELRLHTDLHAIRRQVAAEAYKYYCALPDNEKEKLKEKLLETYKSEKKGVTPEQIRKFEKQLNMPYYCLRGANRAKAIAEGKPVRYNRVCLLACNIYHLSHFRCDVGIASYLVN